MLRLILQSLVTAGAVVAVAMVLPVCPVYPHADGLIVGAFVAMLVSSFFHE